MTQIIEILIPALGSMLLALLGWATAWVRGRTKNESAKAAIDLAMRVARDVVAETKNTVVTRLKEDDGWDPSVAREVKRQAVETVLEHLGTVNVEHLNKALSGGAAAWVGTIVEATVAREKR